MAETSCCARAAGAPTRTNSGSESEPFWKHLEAKGVRRRWQWHPEQPFPSSASSSLGGRISVPEHSIYPFLCLEHLPAPQSTASLAGNLSKVLDMVHAGKGLCKAPDVDAAVSWVTLQGRPPHSHVAANGQGSWGNGNREWTESGGSTTIRDRRQRKGPRAPDLAGGGGR